MMIVIFLYLQGSCDEFNSEAFGLEFEAYMWRSLEMQPEPIPCLHLKLSGPRPAQCPGAKLKERKISPDSMVDSSMF